MSSAHSEITRVQVEEVEHIFLSAPGVGDATEPMPNLAAYVRNSRAYSSNRVIELRSGLAELKPNASGRDPRAAPSQVRGVTARANLAQEMA